MASKPFEGVSPKGLHYSPHEGRSGLEKTTGDTTLKQSSCRRERMNQARAGGRSTRIPAAEKRLNRVRPGFSYTAAAVSRRRLSNRMAGSALRVTSKTAGSFRSLNGPLRKRSRLFKIGTAPFRSLPGGPSESSVGIDWLYFGVERMWIPCSVR